MGEFSIAMFDYWRVVLGEPPPFFCKTTFWFGHYDTLRTVDQKYGDNQSSDLDMTNKWPDIEQKIKNKPTTGDILSPTSMNPATAWCWSARELWKPLGVKNVPWLRRFFPWKDVSLDGGMQRKVWILRAMHHNASVRSLMAQTNFNNIPKENWLVVWNIFYFSIQLGMSSSQLTNSLTPSFLRGVGGSTTNQDQPGYY